MTVPVGARELLSFLLPSRCRDGSLIVLRAYFDDSGTHAGAPVMVWGGLIGTEAQWVEFDQKWSVLLAEPLPGKPRLSKFSLRECNYPDGEFLSYSPPERDRITFLFRRILVETGLFSTAAIIPSKDWDDLVTGKMREEKGNAEQQCISQCIGRALDFARAQDGDNRLAIMLDKGRESPVLHSTIDAIMAYHDRQPEILSVAFGKVAEFTPLQGADMVATESFWYGQKWLSAGDEAAKASARAHFKSFEREMRCEGLILDREAIAENVRIFEFERFQKSFLSEGGVS